MYKVMLVDDEPIIIRGMKQLIDWQKEGYEICGFANSAEEALEKLDEINPDIIITDLVMPEMDGNEFINVVKSKRPNIEAIILSGYGEFEFARKALANGVGDYLVKPTTRTELISALKKVADKIKIRTNNEREYLQLKERMHESLPVLQNRYILEIANGKITDRDSILRLCTLVDFEIKDSSVVSVVNARGELDIKDEENSDVYLDLAVKSACEKYLNKFGKAYTVVDNKNLCIIITDAKKDLNDTSAFELFNGLYYDVKSRYNVDITIGVGSCFNDVKDLRKSYIQAHNALESSFFLGNNQIIHYKNALQYNDEIIAYPMETSEQIIEKMRYDLNISPDQLANDLIDSFVKTAGHDIEMIYHYCCLFNIQLGKVNGSNIHEDHANNESSNYMEEIRKCKTTIELKKHFRGIIKQDINSINKLRSEKLDDVISKVINHIKSNLSGDLTLNEMANVVFMNSVYLSTLFKNKTGLMYHEFVFKERMKKAQKLLLDNRLKVYEVAQSVGYSNARSFSEAFKRFCGTTPSKYVNDHVNKE